MDTDRPFMNLRDVLSLENQALGHAVDLDLDELAERPLVSPNFVADIERYHAGGR